MAEPYVSQIASDVSDVTRRLIDAAAPEPGHIFVLGVSTSEIQGRNIGSAGDEFLAQVVLDQVSGPVRAAHLHLAVQCCEHLNRALVVEWATCCEYGLTQVTVRPTVSAGGPTAVGALDLMDAPVVVDSIAGHLGLDIGDTLIGMHLRPVIVPVRAHIRNIWHAHLTMARTRAPLIGGARAMYP